MSVSYLKGFFMKEIEGYEGLYSVNKNGEVWSHKKYKHKGKFLKQYKTKNGYLTVGLSANRKRKTFLVHRIVAKAFIDNVNCYPEINHIDGDKTNNHVSNLEWVTSSYNQIHAIKNGLQKFTDKHRMTAIETCRKNGKANKGKQNKKLWKLTMSQAEEIRSKHKEGVSMTKLGVEYKVDKGTISSIVKGDRYV